MRTTPARRSGVALGLGVVAISFAVILFREAQPTHPLVAAGIRLAVAAVVLAPITYRGFRRGALPGRVLRTALAAGVLYAFHFGLWVWSLELTTVAASVTLVTATPLVLATVALVTGADRPSRRTWAALGLACVGVATIGGFDVGATPGALLGDGLAFGGALAMAGYLVLVRRLGDLDVWPFAGVATAVGALLLLGCAFVLGIPIEPASPTAFTYLVLAALIPQLVGHGALTWALRHTTPTVVGIATVGEPVGATLLAWALLGEVPTAGIIAGCAVTLAGVALAVGHRAPSAAETGAG